MDNYSKDFKELQEFDWIGRRGKSTAPDLIPISRMGRMIKNEDPYDSKKRMLLQLSNTCLACTMCELGRKDAQKDYIARDPHVLSNLNPKRFMVVGQNPGWHELEKREPFVGAAGQNFDKEIDKYGLSRDDFYITNIVKCWTEGNAKPNSICVDRCRPFLQMELQTIRPLLVIALGAVAFGILCPQVKFSDGLKKITKCTVFGETWSVFAVYHPSPLNLSTRKKEFCEHIKILCKLIKKLKKERGC